MNTESPDLSDLPDVPVRLAATVALLRDREFGEGVEVFLQHRVATMEFAAGATVFPGGGVEDRDFTAHRPWRGPDPQWWAERFDVPADRAAASVRAVVRELFEETGVLLAAPASGPAGERGTEATDDAGPGARAAGRLPDTGARGWRERSEAGDVPIDDLLAESGLVLAADLLRPWDRWTTPPGPRRRYDTLFFVAGLPDGSDPDGGTSEARATQWLDVHEAATLGSLGTLSMMRPTLNVLASLARVSNVAEVLAMERHIVPGGH